MQEKEEQIQKLLLTSRETATSTDAQIQQNKETEQEKEIFKMKLKG